MAGIMRKNVRMRNVIPCWARLFRNFQFDIQAQKFFFFFSFFEKKKTSHYEKCENWYKKSR